MKTYMCKFIAFTFITTVFTIASFAQIASNGNFTLDQTVIANGGGTSSDAGNIYKIEGTIGQSIAGTNSIAPPFALRGGFWAANPFVPTAAGATISGRVENTEGVGLRNITIILSGGTLTAPRIVKSNSFGNFMFEEVEVGQTYVISVSSKKFGFGQPSRTISLQENISDIFFQASWEN